MRINYNCPSCGKRLFTYQRDTRKYGPPLKTCKHCNEDYLDPRYHELAIEGIPDHVFSCLPYLVVFLLGAFILWRGYALYHLNQLGVPEKMQWFKPAVFMGLGLLLILNAVAGIISIKTGLKRRKFEKLLEESNQRLEDTNYRYALEKLGYKKPESGTDSRFYSSLHELHYREYNKEDK